MSKQDAEEYFKEWSRTRDMKKWDHLKFEYDTVIQFASDFADKQEKELREVYLGTMDYLRNATSMKDRDSDQSD